MTLLVATLLTVMKSYDYRLEKAKLYISIPLSAIVRLEKGHYLLFGEVNKAVEMPDRCLYHLSFGRGEQKSRAERRIFSSLAFK